MDRRDGVPRDLVIPAVLDINRQGLAVARDLAHRPELLASVGDERLEADLDLFVHGTTPRPQEWATKPRSASAGPGPTAWTAIRSAAVDGGGQGHHRRVEVRVADTLGDAVEAEGAHGRGDPHCWIAVFGLGRIAGDGGARVLDRRIDLVVRGAVLLWNDGVRAG